MEPYYRQTQQGVVLNPNPLDSTHQTPKQSSKSSVGYLYLAICLAMIGYIKQEFSA